MEEHECQNCFFTGELTQHGKCSRCNSQQVVSMAVISFLLDKQYQQMAAQEPEFLK